MPSALEVLRRQVSLVTHHLHSMPVLVLNPHSRCNCRCVMCDIWRANKTKQEISDEDLAPHVDAIRRLRVQHVSLTGGEALMHANLWKLTERLSPLGVHLSLLSTGLLLEKHAEDVVRHVDEVIVSLDGPQKIHDEIRNVPRAFEKLRDGVAALRRLAPDFPVSGRSVVQRRNFRHLSATASAAREIGLDRLSFLAADTSSEAFNRPGGWDDERSADVGLDAEEVAELDTAMTSFLEAHRGDLQSGFLSESAEQLTAIVRHFEAALGLGEYPGRRCNAPWVSAVVEADGTVLPCFFHPPIGHLRDGPLDDIINGERAIAFRRALDVTEDPTCRRCVCSLYLSPRADAL